MSVNIKHRPYLNTKKVIELYERKDGVPIKYVCTSALGSEEFAMDIFYRGTPHPEFGNKYFGLYRDNRFSSDQFQLFITNADAVEETSFDMINVNDQWHYSRHRHDYNDVGGVAIDGGRAYTRLVGSDLKGIETETFVVRDGEFYVST